MTGERADGAPETPESRPDEVASHETGSHETGSPEAGPTGRRAAPDPLGKRALFSAAGPAPAAAPDPAPPPAPAPAHGDAPPVGGAGGAAGGPDWRRPITVSCSACGATIRVAPLDFLRFQLPLGYWLPRGHYGHRMTCPSCRRRSWVSVTLRRS